MAVPHDSASRPVLSRPLKPAGETQPLRILASCHTWQGATDYGFLRAFRRAGHSVINVPDTDFVPVGWQSLQLKALRRVTLAAMVADYQKALIEAARQLAPQLFFIFKGTYVRAATIDAIRQLGAVAINVYPDVSFTVHGPHIAGALPRYDWIFTTKSYGVSDLEQGLGIRQASFLSHGYDPETHFPAALDDFDRARLASQAAFIGTWSPKKEALLGCLRKALPELDLKVWGNQWDGAAATLGNTLMHRPLFGREYVKAICATDINIAILSEARGVASSGDLSTTRTFEIPAAGGFMLHERTAEVQSFFEEGKECAMFAGADELTAQVRHYLAHPDARMRIAEAGRARCLVADYSVDKNARRIVDRAREIIGDRSSASATGTGRTS